MDADQFDRGGGKNSINLIGKGTNMAQLAALGFQRDEPAIECTKTCCLPMSMAA